MATAGRSGTATVLFTDLADSTSIRGSLGDDSADALRRDHDNLIGEAISSAGGTQVKNTGDGVMAVFSSASDALSAAVSMQQSLHRYNQRAPVPLGVRVGVSAGDVSWEGDDCFGTPVVEASRLCESAQPATILVSEIVRLLAGSRGAHQFSERRSIALKGLGEADACEVLWEPLASALIPLPAGLARPAGDPYVGRVTERAALRTAWKQTGDGSRRAVLLSGEPGLGKTRLASEFAAELLEEGAAVLFGRCDEDLGIPYQPFVEAIRSAADALTDEQLAGIVNGAEDLVRAVPQIAVRLPDLSEPGQADPETQRLQLFEAFDTALGRLASLAPVLLVLDDLHWAEKSTLLLLRHLARSSNPAQLLILGTYRDTELDRGHPLADSLAELRRDPSVERIALRGLEPTDVTDLLRAMAGHDLDDAGSQLAATVHSETEGNPFFVMEVLRHLAETGAIVRRDDGRWVAGVQEIGIPEGVREVIGRRLSRLSKEANAVLAAAAVVGREFEPHLVAEIARVDLEAVLDSLDEAETARLIEVGAGQPHRFGFAHALVRRTLYDEIPTTRRLRLHKRAGETLEASASEGSRLDELARHFGEAAALGEVERALKYMSMAAAEAVSNTAYEQAASYYEQMIHLLDDDSADSDPQRARILIDAAEVYRLSGDPEAAHEAVVSAVAIARRLGDGELMVRAAITRHGLRAWSDAGTFDEELVAHLEAALDLLPDVDSGVRATAMARVASELYFLEAELDRRLKMTTESIEMARRIGDPEVLAFVLNCAVWGVWSPFNPQERLDLAIEVVELARESGNVQLEATGWSWQPNCYAELGDRQGFDAAVAEEVSLRERLRSVEQDWVTEVHLGVQTLLDGRMQEASDHSDAALAAGEKLGMEIPGQLYGVQQLSRRRLVGGLDELVPLVEAMVEQFPLIPSWRAGRVLLALDLDDDEALREAYQWFADASFDCLPRDANWGIGISIVSFGANRLNDPIGAKVLYEMLAPFEDFGITVGIPAEVGWSVQLPLALLDETLGRVDEADRRFREALAFSERFRNLPWIVGTKIDYAKALRRWSRHDEANALAAEALATAREYGMHRYVGIAEKLIETP